MCHRFIPLSSDELNEMLESLETTGRAIIAEANTQTSLPDAWPGSSVPILVPGLDRLAAQELTWGFNPTWGDRIVFNTRIETALDQMQRGESSGMWGNILSHGRCLVPTRGFFERHRTLMSTSPTTGKPVKQQVRFTLPGARGFLMAGVQRDGCFSVVTTAANPDVASVHDRMPIVLGRGESALWLYGDASELARIADRSVLRLASEVI